MSNGESVDDGSVIGTATPAWHLRSSALGKRLPLTHHEGPTNAPLSAEPARVTLRAETSGTLRPMARAEGAASGDLSKLEEEAAKVLPPESLAYILAGAGDIDTTRANAAAFR